MADRVDSSAWRKGDVVGFVPMDVAEPMPEGGTGKSFWYVGCTVPKRESDVAAAIRALGFATFLPMRTVLTRTPRSGRPVKARYPLFPRYVFFEIVPHPRCWQAIRATRDLTGILANQDVPVRVEDEEIGGLMVADDMQMFDETIGPNAVEIRRNDRVSIVAGAWQGYEGVVRQATRPKAVLQVIGKGGKRDVRVSLDLLRILA